MAWKLVYTGKIKPGMTPAEVRQNLAQLPDGAGTDPDQLFSGSEITLKTGLDADTAASYQALLHQAGLLCEMRAASEPELTGTAAAPPAPGASQQTPEIRPWWIQRGQQQLGPYSREELKAMMAAGQLQGSDKLWKQGLEQALELAAAPWLGLPPPSAAGAPFQRPPPAINIEKMARPRWRLVRADWFTWAVMPILFAINISNAFERMPPESHGLLIRMLYIWGLNLGLPLLLGYVLYQRQGYWHAGTQFTAAAAIMLVLFIAWDKNDKTEQPTLAGTGNIAAVLAERAQALNASLPKMLDAHRRLDHVEAQHNRLSFAITLPDIAASAIVDGKLPDAVADAQLKNTCVDVEGDMVPLPGEVAEFRIFSNDHQPLSAYSMTREDCALPALYARQLPLILPTGARIDSINKWGSYYIFQLSFAGAGTAVINTATVDKAWAGLDGNFCQDPKTRAMISAGASFSFRFFGSDQHLIQQDSLSYGDCNTHAAAMPMVPSGSTTMASPAAQVQSAPISSADLAGLRR